MLVCLWVGVWLCVVVWVQVCETARPNMFRSGSVGRGVLPWVLPLGAVIVYIRDVVDCVGGFGGVRGNISLCCIRGVVLTCCAVGDWFGVAIWVHICLDGARSA